MADSWEEYFRGQPGREEIALADQQRKWREATSSPLWQAAQIAAARGRDDFDPRELLYAVRANDGTSVQDMMYPQAPKNSEFEDAAQYALQKAWEYPTEMGMRMRDTGIRSAQELSKGNLGSAAMLAARTPLAPIIPYAAAGTPHDADDWREDARNAGWTPSGIMAFDIGTDPEAWLTAPVAGPAAFVVPALPFAAGRAARAGLRYGDDALHAARYGRGIPTHLVDEAGDVIRRLRSTPVGAH